MPFLRRKKKKQEPSEPPLSFEEVLSRILFPGTQRTEDTAEISFDSFEKAGEAAGPGSSFFAYGETNELRFVLVEPNLSEGVQREDRKERESSLPPLASLAAFLSLPLDHGGSSPADAAEPCLVVRKRFDREMITAILWLAAEFAIFTVSGPGRESYLAVERRRADRLRKMLDEDEEFRRNIRESIESGAFDAGTGGLAAEGLTAGGVDAGSDHRPPGTKHTIDLTRPLDFPAGYTLLPRRAPAGKNTAEVRFESVTGEVSPEPEEGIWFTYTCRLAPGAGPVYYSIPLRTKTEAHTKYFGALLTALVKYAAEFSRREIGNAKAGGTISAPPDASALRGSVRVDARISVEDKAFPVRIYVTPAFVQAVSAAAGIPAAGDPAEGSDTLLDLLSLNLSLLARGLERIDRAGVFTERTELLRISELLNLLGPDDSRKVVQNFFIARGRGLGNLTRLFYYRSAGGEEGKARLITDPQFRKDEFLSLLPRNLREEWTPLGGYSRSRDELYKENRRAVEEISEAAESDRLILSHRGRNLLRRAVRDRVDAGYKKKVDQIFQNDLAARLLTSLPKPAAQRTVSAYPSEELARILVAAPDFIETAAPFISKNKRRDVEEQYRLLERDFETGRLSYHGIYRSLYTLLAELKHTREEEEENRSS